MRKLAVTYSDLKEHHLDKIKNTAEGFRVLTGEAGFKDSHIEDKDNKLGFKVLTGEDAKAAIGECEIIFGHASPELLASAKKLKWLHAQSAGVDFYMRQGSGLADSVILTNSAGMHGISISEHMLAMTLMLMRRLHSYVHLQKKHEWKYLGSVKSIYNSTITVVGLGGIGGHYARRCKALGATIRGVVRTPRDDLPEYADEIFTIDQLDKAIKNADVVALTLPETHETTNLFTKERMLNMKKGSIIINIGRGTAIDQNALIELLESGHLGGAGLDVTNPEPLPPDSKLWDLPNVVLTPHVSGGATLALTADMIVDRFIKYLEDYINGRPFERVVDKKAGY